MVGTTRHIFSGKVEVESNLDVGSNIKIDDTVGIVLGHGTITADKYFGNGSSLTGVLSSLEDAASKGNTLSSSIQFTNPETSISATGNIETGGLVNADGFVGDGSQLSNIQTTLQDAADNGNTINSTVLFTNSDTSFIAEGSVFVDDDVYANAFIGDGRRVRNLPTTLEDAAHNGNTISLPVYFTNVETSVGTSGRLGIRTDSPEFDLDVHGSANVGVLRTTRTLVNDINVVLEPNFNSNVSRIANLELANVIQANLITITEDNLNNNADRIFVLERDLDSNTDRINVLEC
jgi:hypothetical protein